MAARNAFYAQSGGVTAVVNATAAGVIETARKHKAKIGKVFAGRNGIIGALTEDLIQRDDDQEVTVRKRLEVYHSQTKPLVDYYSKWSATGDAKAPKCRKIAGVGSVEDIKQAAFAALK